MKILSRLNEEGSNADEPMNIKLSDYSRFELLINHLNNSEQLIHFYFILKCIRIFRMDKIEMTAMRVTQAAAVVQKMK